MQIRTPAICVRERWLITTLLMRSAVNVAPEDRNHITMQTDDNGWASRVADHFSPHGCTVQDLPRLVRSYAVLDAGSFENRKARRPCLAISLPRHMRLNAPSPMRNSGKVAGSGTGEAATMTS